MIMIIEIDDGLIIMIINLIIMIMIINLISKQL